MSGIKVKAEMVACFVLSENEMPPSILLFQRNGVDPYAPGSWQIVYGHVEADETPEETVVREIQEESGLSVTRLYTLNETMTFYEKVSKSLQIVPLFVAFVDAENPIALDVTEHVDAEWIEFEEAYERLPWPAQRRALEILQDLVELGKMPEIMKLTLP